SIRIQSNEGNSNFHSMQIRVEKQFSRDSQFMASYTWQKTIQDSYQNPFDRSAYPSLNGPGKWLTLSYLWGLPFGELGNRAVTAIAGSCQITSVDQLQDGSPLRPPMIPPPPNVDNYSQMPNRIRSGFIDAPTRDHWFDVTAFRVPAAY